MLRRILTRGEEHARNGALLLAMGDDIFCLHRKTQNNRTNNRSLRNSSPERYRIEPFNRDLETAAVSLCVFFDVLLGFDGFRNEKGLSSTILKKSILDSLFLLYRFIPTIQGAFFYWSHLSFCFLLERRDC